MSGFWHRLSHLLGWNTGRVVSFWHDSKLYIGFKCNGCGEINHATETGVNYPKQDFLSRNLS